MKTSPNVTPRGGEGISLGWLLFIVLMVVSLAGWTYISNRPAPIGQMHAATATPAP